MGIFGHRPSFLSRGFVASDFGPFRLRTIFAPLTLIARLVFWQPLLVGETEEEAALPDGGISDEQKLNVYGRFWGHGVGADYSCVGYGLRCIIPVQVTTEIVLYQR